MKRARLLKLADHLEHGTLMHRVFDFGVVNAFYATSKGKHPKRNSPEGCGTAGCALGECPAVWPRRWRFGKLELEPIMEPFNDTWVSARKFFEISDMEARFLFMPGVDSGLPETATKQEVARHIRRFVKSGGEMYHDED